MTIEKLRGVGKTGIIADLDPYDLPLDAFSAGVNISFRNAKVASGPVFRSVLHLGQRFLGSNHIRRRRRVCMTKCG